MALAAQASINAADTAWMMTSTALVLLMTLPGIALFYAGMVRRKNVLATMAAVVAIAAAVSLTWFAVGYSLAFTAGWPWLGGLSRWGFSGFEYLKEAGQVAVSHVAPNVPESVYAMFQLTFAIITTALVLGAFVERMRFSAVLWFALLWSVLVYAPVAHWVWEPGGWLAQMGALDFAGGSVVHVNAGIAGLVCAYALGPRKGYGREAFEPYSLALTMMGAGLLWVGWFGFNAGSAVAADGRAGLAMLVTHIAAAAGAMSWMVASGSCGAAPRCWACARAWWRGWWPSRRRRASSRRWPRWPSAPSRGWPATGAPRGSSTCWARTTRWTCSACTASAASWARCSRGCSPIRASRAPAATC
jgi:Amt family ammonium transporter